MTRFITKDKAKQLLSFFLATAFWLAVWQLVCARVSQELLLVSPGQAFARLIALSGMPAFWFSVLGTCLRVLAGFSLSLLTGSLLAVPAARFKAVNALLSPLLGVVRATPVASFIILVLLWFKTDTLPGFIAFLMVVPLVFTNLLAGIRSADRNLLEMARVFKLSRRKIFSWIYVPAALPHFISACSAGLGFAWKSAIAAEVLCLPQHAIGRQFYNAKIYLETADLFAWTIAVVLFSILIENLFIGALKRLQKKLAAAGI